MGKLVSIIIPIYNVENYIEKCLFHIINQTYSNLEIILINDGSTDKSLNICENYIDKDSRIKLINKENEGLARARATGFSVATGDYILFLDSDDYINLEFIEKMIEPFQINEVDMVISSIKYVFYNQNKTYMTSLQSNQVYDRKDILKKLLISKDVKDYAWGKLFRKDTIMFDYFGKERVYEDIDFTYKVILNCNKIMYQNEAIYFYVQRENSILSSNFNERHLQLITITEKMINNIISCEPSLKVEGEYRYILSILMILIPIQQNNLISNEQFSIVYKKYISIINNLNSTNPYLSLKQKLYMFIYKYKVLTSLLQKIHWSKKYI